MNKKVTRKLAAGVIAVGGKADAQIVYTDVNPDETYTADHDLELDLNNDGIVDFTLLIGAGPTRYAVRLAPEMGNEALGSMSGNFFYPFMLNMNDPIDPAQTTWNGSANGSYLTMAWVYSAGGSYGNWLSATDKYLGLRFFVGTNVHYGWVRLDVAATTSSITVVYKDYAYNTVAEQGILAGQTTIGLNEAVKLDANVFAANNTLNVNLNQHTTGTINLINMMGQTVKSVDITATDMKLPLDGIETGIYMVAIQTESGSFTQKIYVK
jgi:hypothetical protein